MHSTTQSKSLMLHGQASVAAKCLQQYCHSIQALPIVIIRYLYFAPFLELFLFSSPSTIPKVLFSTSNSPTIFYRLISTSLHLSKMNNRSPQQVAADYVRSQYNSFWANPAWNVPVPNPLPLGWIDLSNIPAHPRHARSVKRMIFEAQHPELFTFEEKQVTFALVPTPFRIPPGVNPASIIAPAPGRLFLQTR